MKPLLRIILALVLSSPSMLFGQTPAGIWVDKDKDTFQLSGTSTISGQIRSLNPPTTKDGKTLVDIHNPDPAKRKVPLVGFVFLKGFKPAGASVWNAGTIYDPKSGKTYSCTLRLIGDDTLEVHGFVGISLLGRTERWRREMPSGKQ